jgi:predicted ATP-dependent endonuclease of OLD family
MNKLEVSSFGPIEKASLEFGDLTLLVGPQASGKSLIVQLLKLLIDKVSIFKTLEHL